jgi:hypothetical protein
MPALGLDFSLRHGPYDHPASGGRYEHVHQRADTRWVNKDWAQLVPGPASEGTHYSSTTSITSYTPETWSFATNAES